MLGLTCDFLVRPCMLDIDFHSAMPWWIMITVTLRLPLQLRNTLFCVGLKFLTKCTLTTPFCGAVRIRPYTQARKNHHYQMLSY
jgi:hypothetical protein